MLFSSRQLRQDPAVLDLAVQFGEDPERGAMILPLDETDQASAIETR
jgi:hypothetical protein